MYRRLLAWAIALLGLAAPLLAQAPSGLDPERALTQYSLDGWSTDEGLPQNTVNALVQGRDGYLWIGTYDGLARFDGFRFTVFHRRNTAGLKDNGVRALVEDKEGALWIGTNGGGVSRYKDGRFEHLQTGRSGPDDMVWALCPDSESGVWAGTNGGTLFRLRGEAFEARFTNPGREPINEILQDRRGAIWIATQGAGLRRLDPDGSVTTYTTEEGLPGAYVRTLLEDREGRLWIGTAGAGVARFDGGSFRSWTRRDNLPDDFVSDILEDRRGTLWLATRRGLARFRNGTFDVLDKQRGLQDNTLYALYEGQDGTLWIGTQGAGALRLRDGSFAVYSTREGLADEFVSPIVEDASGVLWVGTPAGLSRFSHGRWTTLTTRDGLCYDVIRSLWAGPTGELWIGTYGGGVCRLAGGRFSRLTTRDGLVSDSVRAVLGTRDGSLWFGTVGGLSRFHEGRWQSYTAEQGLPSASVISLAEDREGRLLVGTDGGGVAYVEAGRVMRTVTRRDGLPSDVILALYLDADDVLWVGTNGGLGRVSADGVASYTSQHGLPTDSTSQILDDRAGNLWVGTSRGVSRLSKKELAEVAARGGSLHPLNLDRADGLKSNQCTAPALPAGYRSRDGRLWFATTRGVAVVDPARLRAAAAPPAAIVESLSAGDVEHEARNGLRLGPDLARLVVRYTGASLLSPERVRFRYRLEGYDEAWVDAGAARSAVYTGLRPGDYRFVVEALMESGARSPNPASVAFAVVPRFSQTPWFYASAGGLVALVAFSAYRLRTAQLRGRERELAALVEEHTRGLQHEKERAERARQDAERQRRIAQEADASKTDILGIAAHDIKNPLQTILGLSELLAGRADEAVAEIGRAVQRSSRRILSLIDDLLATAALEGRVELSLQRVDLGSLAAQVVEEHRARAEAKRQLLKLRAQRGCEALLDEARGLDVLSNLVSNAVKYCPRGAVIEVMVRGDEHQVAFEVRDDGPGLSEDDRARLFRRFERLSARPTGGESSTGLGLYIVKRLVELQGGRVYAESDGHGKGARFVVELPRAGAPAPR